MLSRISDSINILFVLLGTRICKKRIEEIPILLKNTPREKEKTEKIKGLPTEVGGTHSEYAQRSPQVDEDF